MRKKIGWLVVLITLGCGLPRLVADAADALGPRLVFMISEDEYHTWETLPAFGRDELAPRGYRVTVVLSDPADKNNFPGLVDALRDADLLLVSVRRRTPPHAQLDAVRAFLAAGKPLIGVRTACHAFAPEPGAAPLRAGLDAWPEFDPAVLGGHYVSHHGQGPVTVVTSAPGAGKNSLLQGIEVAQLRSSTKLYKVSPLAADATPLLIGAIPGQAPEPVAWTHRFGPRHARVFYTSLGAPEDFQHSEFRQLLSNAIRWALGH